MLLTQDANLRLRGGADVRVTWSPGTTSAPPLVVYLGERDIARDLALRLPAVVLAAEAGVAREALEWGADHAQELGADPQRLMLIADHGAAGVLAALAREARDRGWPPVERAAVLPRNGAPLDALVRLLQLGSQSFGNVGGMRPG